MRCVIDTNLSLHMRLIDNSSRELLDASIDSDIDYFNIKVMSWKKLDTKAV